MTLENRFTAPQDWQWGTFNNPLRADMGHHIRYGFCKAANPKSLAVIAPGRTETSEQYFEFIRDLLARNFSVIIMDWQGQGGSYRYNGDNSRQTSMGFDYDLDDFDAFYQMIDTVDDFAALPKCLIAHSMGGHLTMRYLVTHPNHFKCAVMVAPMIGIKMSSLVEPIAHSITSIAGLFGQSNQYAPGFQSWSPTVHDTFKSLISSDETRREVQKYWYDNNASLQCGGVTYGWLHEALKSIQNLKGSPLLSDINIPILFTIAEDDAVVSNNATIELAKRIPNAVLENIPESQHGIIMERDEIRNTFLRTFDGFTQKHLHLI